MHTAIHKSVTMCGVLQWSSGFSGTALNCIGVNWVYRGITTTKKNLFQSRITHWRREELLNYFTPETSRSVELPVILRVTLV